MANILSDVATLQAAALLNGTDRLTSYGGELKFIPVQKTSYTAATTDPLYLCILPKGALLNLALTTCTHGDAGDALTGKIGLFTVASTPVAIDDDAYGAGLALGTDAGVHSLAQAGTPGAYLTTPTRLTQDAWLVVTWTVATNAASHSQYWNVVYS